MEVYRADPSLLDVDAKDAIDAAARYYRAVEEQHDPPTIRLAERAQRVFASIQGICDWRLGRTLDPDETPEAPIPVTDLVACLRKIQKSIPRWSKQGGRRGYLDFVSKYVP